MAEGEINRTIITVGVGIHHNFVHLTVLTEVQLRTKIILGEVGGQSGAVNHVLLEHT